MKTALFYLVTGLGLLLSTPAFAENSRSENFVVDYDTLSALPYNSQVSYLNAFQDVLVAMDERSGSSTSLDRMLDQILIPAYADATTGPFCINEGVVRPKEECTEGPNFHSFPTTDYLEKQMHLGLPACVGGGMPCSPFFGFHADGSPFCNDANNTRDCKQQSAEEKNEIKLADVLGKCLASTTGKSDKPALDCKNLAKFYSKQTALVEQFCVAGSKRACKTLKAQATQVKAEVDKLDAGKLTKLLTESNQAQAVTPTKPPCPPGQPAAPASQPPVAVPAPAAQVVDKTIPVVGVPADPGIKNCTVQMKIGTDLDNKDQDLVDYWKAGFKKAKAGSADSADQCVQFTTQKNVVFKLARNSLGIPTGGTVSVPGKTANDASTTVFLDRATVETMLSLSKVYDKDGTLGLNGDEKLDNYLPATPIRASGTMTDLSKNTYSAVEYTTANGTVIRYALTDKNYGQLVMIKNGDTTTLPTPYPAYNQLN